MTAKKFPEFCDSAMLIHIAFHYNSGRLKYLQEVIATINKYEFRQIHIVIDTNDGVLESWVQKLSFPSLVTYQVVTHSSLSHPFLLTWQHREHIGEQRENYEYFMYLEDDIAVSYESLQYWRTDSILLFPQGKIRGFIRSEINAKNEIVSTDYFKNVRCKEVLCLGRKAFIRPKNPYQGFWVYSKLQLNVFISSRCWEDANHSDWAVRERASAGMIWLNSDKHNLVVPMQDFRIPDYVLVRHLPNNYALDDNVAIGTLKISDLIPKRFFHQLCMKMKLLIGSVLISE